MNRLNKLKILITILVISALFLGAAFFVIQTNLSRKTAPNTPSNVSDPSAKDVSEENFPGNNTDGVWIKKYPENYACFKFETPEGIKIVADPYMMNEIITPDVVTESHQHADHIDISKLKDPYKLIKETGLYQDEGIKITGYSGKHNKGDTTETNIIFVYELDGIKIAHFASQGELPSDETLEKIGHADVLLIQASIKPEYATSKMNLEETNYIIQKLSPEIVIPEHGSENSSIALAAYLDSDVEFIESGEIVVTRSELDASKSLRVLDLDIDVPKSQIP